MCWLVGVRGIFLALVTSKLATDELARDHELRWVLKPVLSTIGAEMLKCLEFRLLSEKHTSRHKQILCILHLFSKQYLLKQFYFIVCQISFIQPPYSQPARALLKYYFIEVVCEESRHILDLKVSLL